MVDAANCPPLPCNCLPELDDGSTPVHLYTDGDDLYAAMLDAIAGARESIAVESYIFASDAVGWRFARALADKAREGVHVRVLVDSAGSLFWTSREMERFFQDSKVDFRWFRRWTWRSPGQYNRRDHRKLLVVDGKQAFLGGFNLHQENSSREHGALRIRDTHVQIGAELAVEAAQQFDAIWANDKEFGAVDPDRANGILLSNVFRNCHRRFHCLYQDVLAEAKQYAYLTTPYFVPDHLTQRALVAAASRGVDVRLLLPAKWDFRAVWWAARAAYAPLLAKGIRIYEYGPRPLHAKTAVVDDKWGLVGSANLDYRSFFVNYEIALLLADASFAARLRDVFRLDLEQAQEIQETVWTRRPWSHRACESIGWVGRRWF